LRFGLVFASVDEDGGAGAVEGQVQRGNKAGVKRVVPAGEEIAIEGEDFGGRRLAEIPV
jgi:hypothetical protein